MLVKWHQSLPQHIKNDTADLQSTVYGASISPSILQTKSCFICRFSTPKSVENKNKTPFSHLNNSCKPDNGNQIQSIEIDT
jgi:hypothetical protein